MSLFRRNPRRTGEKLFFATDIHGSDDCFRKFLNAGRAYGVQYLVLGGDILGKLLVPVVRTGNRTFSCTYGEHVYAELDEAGKQELVRAIRRCGHYPVFGTAEELAELSDPEHRDATFRAVARESIAEWVSLADERLRGTGIRCFVAPGNDDFLEIDSVLQESELLEFAEDRCIRIDDRHTMITTGYSNPTPWDTERELLEEELAAKIRQMAQKASDPASMIAVIHPPPYDSGLDSAPALDAEFGMKLSAAGVEMMPVGSRAVRAFIEETEPMLTLHGHVHEGGGAIRIGRTLCINPGSAYTMGALLGALVEFGDGEVLVHQFVNA